LAGGEGVFANGGAPSPEGLGAARQALMRDASLQFRFDKAPPPPPPTHLPAWLNAIVNGIAAVLRVLAPFLGWIFIGGIALALLAVLAFLFRETIRTRWPQLFKRKAKPPAPVDWRPDAAVARALLQEADKLAAAGDFAGAVRLLLHRSVEEIEGRRPRLVKPAYTAREIGALDDIPDKARATFAGIAAVVERSFFGGRGVDAEAFATCRRAYEAFAFPGAWA
jgi:hypothetical protein